MRTTMTMLVVTASVLAASAQADALGPKRRKGSPRRQVHGPVSDATKRAATPGTTTTLRPRRYHDGHGDLARHPGTELPPGAAGERYRVLRPRPGGHFLIERTRHARSGLERGYSRLGLAGRRFRRVTFCVRGCGAGQIDPSVYRRVKLGGAGVDRYMLWLPDKGTGQTLIERVAGATGAADLSPLDL